MDKNDGAASLVRSDALLAVLDDPEFSFITRRERCIHGGKPEGPAMTVPVIGVAVEWEIEVNRGMYAKQAKGPTLAAALEKLQSRGLVTPNAPHQARAVASRPECGCSASSIGGEQ